jgi:hypothetical protein
VLERVVHRGARSASGAVGMTSGICGAGHCVSADAPEGLCPKCVADFVSDVDPEHESELETDPERVGEFEIVKRLGRGGWPRVPSSAGRGGGGAEGAA